MIRLFTLTAAILLCTGAARAEGLRGADLPLPADQRVDFHVKQILASRLFEAMSNLSHVDIAVDACAGEKRIDITLRNAPFALVFDALASQAGLEYHTEGNAIRVVCAGTAVSTPAPAAPERRANLRGALRRAFPAATEAQIERAISTLETELGHG